MHNINKQTPETYPSKTETIYDLHTLSQEVLPTVETMTTFLQNIMRTSNTLSEYKSLGFQGISDRNIHYINQYLCKNITPKKIQGMISDIQKDKNARSKHKLVIQQHIDTALDRYNEHNKNSLESFVRYQVLENKIEKKRTQWRNIMSILELRMLRIDSYLMQLTGMGATDILYQPIKITNTANETKKDNQYILISDVFIGYNKNKAIISKCKDFLGDLFETGKNSNRARSLTRQQGIENIFELLRIAHLTSYVYEQCNILYSYPGGGLRNDSHLSDMITGDDRKIQTNTKGSLNENFDPKAQEIQKILEQCINGTCDEEYIISQYQDFLSNHIGHGYTATDNYLLRREITERLGNEILYGDLINKIEFPFEIRSLKPDLDDSETITASFNSNNTFQNDINNITCRYGKTSTGMILELSNEETGSALYKEYIPGYRIRIHYRNESVIQPEQSNTTSFQFPDLIFPTDEPKPGYEQGKTVRSFTSIKENTGSETQAISQEPTHYFSQKRESLSYKENIDKKVYLTASNLIFTMIQQLQQGKRCIFDDTNNTISREDISTVEDLQNYIQERNAQFVEKIFLSHIKQQFPNSDIDYIESHSTRYIHNISSMLSSLSTGKAETLVRHVRTSAIEKQEGENVGKKIQIAQEIEQNIGFIGYKQGHNIVHLANSGNSETKQKFITCVKNSIHERLELDTPFSQIKDISIDTLLELISKKRKAKSGERLKFFFSGYDKDQNINNNTMDKYIENTIKSQLITGVEKEYIQNTSYTLSHILLQESIDAISPLVTGYDSSYENPGTQDQYTSETVPVIYSDHPQASILSLLTNLRGTGQGNMSFDTEEMIHHTAQQIVLESVLLYMSGGITSTGLRGIRSVQLSRRLGAIAKSKQRTRIAIGAQKMGQVSKSIGSSYLGRYVSQSIASGIGFHMAHSSLSYGIGNIDDKQLLETLTYTEGYIHSIVIMALLGAIPTLSSFGYETSAKKNIQRTFKIQGKQNKQIEVGNIRTVLTSKNIQIPLEIAGFYGIENIVFPRNFIQELQTQFPNADKNDVERVALLQQIAGPIVLVLMLKGLHNLPLGSQQNPTTIERITFDKRQGIATEVHFSIRTGDTKTQYKFNQGTRKLMEKDGNTRKEVPRISNPTVFAPEQYIAQRLQSTNIEEARRVYQNTLSADNTQAVQDLLIKHMGRRERNKVEKEKKDKILQAFLKVHTDPQFNVYKTDGEGNIQYIDHKVFKIPRLQQGMLRKKIHYLDKTLHDVIPNDQKRIQIISEALKTGICGENKLPNLNKANHDEILHVLIGWYIYNATPGMIKGNRSIIKAFLKKYSKQYPKHNSIKNKIQQIYEKNTYLFEEISQDLQKQNHDKFEIYMKYIQKKNTKPQTEKKETKQKDQLLHTLQDKMREQGYQFSYNDIEKYKAYFNDAFKTKKHQETLLNRFEEYGDKKVCYVFSQFSPHFIKRSTIKDGLTIDHLFALANNINQKHNISLSHDIDPGLKSKHEQYVNPTKFVPRDYRTNIQMRTEIYLEIFPSGRDKPEKYNIRKLIEFYDAYSNNNLLLLDEITYYDIGTTYEKQKRVVFRKQISIIENFHKHKQKRSQYFKFIHENTETRDYINTHLYFMFSHTEKFTELLDMLSANTLFDISNTYPRILQTRIEEETSRKMIRILCQTGTSTTHIKYIMQEINPNKLRKIRENIGQDHLVGMINAGFPLNRLQLLTVQSRIQIKRENMDSFVGSFNNPQTAYKTIANVVEKIFGSRGVYSLDVLINNKEYHAFIQNMGDQIALDFFTMASDAINSFPEPPQPRHQNYYFSLFHKHFIQPLGGEKAGQFVQSAKANNMEYLFKKNRNTFTKTAKKLANFVAQYETGKQAWNTFKDRGARQMFEPQEE